MRERLVGIFGIVSQAPENRRGPWGKTGRGTAGVREGLSHSLFRGVQEKYYPKKAR